MGPEDLFHKRKARLAETHRREKAKRAPYERILIVCEGMKAEPHYFHGLCLALRLHPANVVIDDRKSGLDPKSLVAFAVETFKKDKDFDHVFCVFDKGKHISYNAALDKIRAESSNKSPRRFQLFLSPKLALKRRMASHGY